MVSTASGPREANSKHTTSLSRCPATLAHCCHSPIAATALALLLSLHSPIAASALSAVIALAHCCHCTRCWAHSLFAGLQQHSIPSSPGQQPAPSGTAPDLCRWLRAVAEASECEWFAGGNAMSVSALADGSLVAGLSCDHYKVPGWASPWSDVCVATSR